MKSSLFVKCMLVSGALHAIAMTIFFTCPVHFIPSSFTLGKTPPTPFEDDEIVILKKNAALEESFREFAAASSPESQALPLQAISKPALPILEKPLSLDNFLLLPDTAQQFGPICLPSQILSISDEEMSTNFLSSSLTLDIPDPSIERNEPPANPFLDLAMQIFSQKQAPENLVDFEFLPSPEEFKLSTPSPAAPSSHAAIDTDISLLSKQQQLPEQSSPPTQNPLQTPPLSLQLTTPLAPHYPLSSISNYGIPEYNIVEWNDSFDVDIKTLAREEGGYLFSLTLFPKVDLTEHRLKQNYYFLIDRSNTIERNRYQSFKRAVTRAIASLREGDNFNIIIFDSKFARLSDTLLPYNKKNQRMAEEFLERQPHGRPNLQGGAASTNMYSSLPKIIPAAIHDDEAYTAILISDGDTSLKPQKQRNLINSWLDANRGKITLYTAAVGQDNNLSSLDLLGTASRGSLLYSDTHTGFPRKLAKLILSVRSPIAKEMSLSIAPSDPSSRIRLFPSSSRLPYLFSDHPFVLYGTADKLSDFTMVLEGKNKGGVLTIKKPISFASAKPASRLLSKQWASQQAHLFYDQFLQEGKPALLEEAKKLLADELAHPRR